jgi:16S rRNA (adenine1518-N6/adenine1519-N6)-dimethyltransferase
VYDARLFDEIVRRGFSQRRKQVRKQMPDTGDWEEAAKLIDVPETARAEEISLEQWVDLTRYYDDHPLKDNPQDGDEIFDVVDEGDNVLRQETRDVVHREGLLHRAVHLFVFNKRKELFLQKRSRLKDRNPGVWGGSAAGHLNAGESYEPAAIRELAEELGVHGAEIQDVGGVAACENTGWEHIRLYLAQHDGAMRFPCSEVESGQWFLLDEARAWIAARPQDFSSGFIECWKVFDGMLGDKI